LREQEESKKCFLVAEPERKIKIPSARPHQKTVRAWGRGDTGWRMRIILYTKLVTMATEGNKKTSLPNRL
jgi:hypothetical protein